MTVGGLLEFKSETVFAESLEERALISCPTFANNLNINFQGKLFCQIALCKYFLNGSTEFYYNMTMSNLSIARMEVCMAYRLANQRTEHSIFFFKLNVRKDWKHILEQKSQQFLLGNPLCIFG